MAAQDLNREWKPKDRTALAARIRDGGRRSIELRDADAERLVVGLGPVLQDAERHLFAQQNRPIGRTAEMNAGMNSVAERDIVGQLVQFPVEVQTVAVQAVAVQACMSIN